MNNYIGVEIIQAIPMLAKDAANKGYKIEDESLHSEGYEIIRSNGINSWCPKDVFEEANRPIDGMTFGFAIEALKKGLKVARKGWNGKGMYLWLKPAVTIKSDWCKDPMLKEIVDANGGKTEAFGTICMKTADNRILTGWSGNQIDVLSEDWIIVE